MRKLSVLLVSILVAVVVLNAFYYVDIPNKCLIRVVPNVLPSNWNAKEIISILKNTSPENYDFMCKNISTIDKNSACGGFDGGCFYSNDKRKIYIGNDQNNVALTTAIVVHELCHARQFSEKRPILEPECYEKGWDYMRSVLVY